MIKTKQAFLLYGAGLIFLLFIYIVMEWASVPKPAGGANSQKVTLYFLNAAANSLEGEERSVKKAGGGAELIKTVLNELNAGPASGGLVRAVPRGISINSAKLIEKDKTLEMDMSPEYAELNPRDEMFCRAALVYTLTQFDFIDGAEFYIDGKPLASALGRPAGVFTRENFSAFPQLGASRVNTMTFTLYFTDEEGTRLRPETRTAEVETNIEHTVVRELIKGPERSGRRPVLPPELKINAANVTDYVCYLDLSADFLKKTDADYIAVYSIVNSLTKLQGVQKVQFLIDSQRVSDFKGGIDLSHPIERNEELIP
ncbi:MAG: GerMN domain-containing protein [Clostridiales bacterium]|nr:GerMN domain-containing protein [Clostridiales bacterium]